MENNQEFIGPALNYTRNDISSVIPRKRIAYSTEKSVYPRHFPVVSFKVDSKEYTLNNIQVPPEVFNQVYPLLTQSKVGKGAFTVLDEKVRRSREIPFSDSSTRLDEFFQVYMTTQVRKMLLDMNAGTLTSLTPHKIVFYDQGDFFSEHMDSIHTPGQNMSCVVELCESHPSDSNKTNKSCLIIDGKVIDNFPDSCSITVFYRDIPHRVEKTDKHRVSITFDLVVEKDPVINEKVQIMIEDLIMNGVKRIGFFTEHRYIKDEPFRGGDHTLFSSLEPFIKKHERIPLQTADRSLFFLPIVWNAMNMGPECGVLLRDKEYDEEEDPEEDLKKNDRSVIHNYKKKTYIPGSVFTPEKPSYDCERVFRREFCLGDVFVIETENANPRIVKESDGEDYLGNEGFYETVQENLFVLIEV